MRAEFSLRAEQDLLDIYRYGVENFGIALADTYADGMTQTVHLIADHPHIARLRTEFSPAVRIHHWRSHYIIYIDRPSGISIIRVLHDASDVTRHLAQDTE